MKISEIETLKPKTPAQLRIDALKKAADHASAAASAERQRQRLNWHSPKSLDTFHSAV